MIIAVDFDGVIVDYDGWNGYDDIGEVKEFARKALNELYDRGHTIIIYTCRKELDPVRQFLEEQDLPYHYINENAPEAPDTHPRKIYADVYVDDRALPFKETEDKLFENNWLTIAHTILQQEGGEGTR